MSVGVPESGAVGPQDAPTHPARLERDADLAADGWVRRFTGSPPQLADLVELYRSTGQEVLLDEVLPGELAPGCAGCTLALSLFKVVYTRQSER